MKNNITVFLEVFNEESRIESCLKSFRWADELIVFDKQSTDRTREIAQRLATKVITSPYCEASENSVRNIAGEQSNEWCFFITASSLIHPELVDEIIKLTSDPTFAFDVIGLPYGMYAFGITSPYSPWTNARKYALIRRSVLRLSCELHREIRYASDRVFDMPRVSEVALLLHCTHRDADDFFLRHLRYAKYEAKGVTAVSRKKALWGVLKEIIRSIAYVVIRRRSFVLGWDGIALGLGYISYFIMKFVYIWDLHRDNGNVVYPRLRKHIDELWDRRDDEASGQREAMPDVEDVFKIPLKTATEDGKHRYESGQTVRKFRYCDFSES